MGVPPADRDPARLGGVVGAPGRVPRLHLAATRTKLDGLDVPASLSEEAHGDFEEFLDRTNEALDRTESVLDSSSESFAGSTLGVENLALFFGFAYAVALLPFIVLTSYILRAAVIAEHTIASGEFIMDERSHQPLSEARAPATERSHPGDD